MSTIQSLRAFVNQRLTAAVEEIFELLETTITNYEDEIQRQRRLLEVVSEPENHTTTNRAVSPLGIQKERKDQHEEETSLNQEDLKPAYSEEKQLWSSQEEEQLQDTEQDHTTEFTSTSASSKCEDDEDESQSSQLYQRQTQECKDAASSQSFIREKKFHCDLCDKSFTQKKALVIHIRSHTGERPYSCSTCDRCFSQRKTLVVHMRSHTGERPFSCPFCEKSFSVNGTLTRHIRVHTGEKPYNCSVCGRSFSLLTRLKSHKCAGASSNK
ncbi:zinc finger protein 2 homolog [Cheilinus undulatus]|uniref:zinc finger protein 2 homolog n=1 Tax=Cheilinus undulatus TaxID=241271 RepID=UPI001BD25BD4|nr:zinc finger protein 2 homolog [Cheilinus undulatus]